MTDVGITFLPDRILAPYHPHISRTVESSYSRDFISGIERTRAISLVIPTLHLDRFCDYLPSGPHHSHLFYARHRWHKRS